MRPNLFELLKNIGGQCDHIVKIDGIHRLANDLVMVKNLRQRAPLRFPSHAWQIERCDMRRLDLRNELQQRLRIVRRSLQMQLFKHISDNRELVVRVDNRKWHLPAQLADVCAQNIGSKRMKRRQMTLPCLLCANQIGHTLSQFARGLVRKTHRYNRIGRDMPVIDQICHAVRDNPGLAAARTRQNEHGPLVV